MIFRSYLSPGAVLQEETHPSNASFNDPAAIPLLSPSANGQSKPSVVVAQFRKCTGHPVNTHEPRDRI
jgi:hypothetical protein